MTNLNFFKLTYGKQILVGIGFFLLALAFVVAEEVIVKTETGFQLLSFVQDATAFSVIMGSIAMIIATLNPKE